MVRKFTFTLTHLILGLFITIATCCIGMTGVHAQNAYNYYWDFNNSSWASIPQANTTNTVVSNISIVTGEGNTTQPGGDNYHKWRIYLDQYQSAPANADYWFLLENPANEGPLQDAQIRFDKSPTKKLGNVYIVLPQGCEVTSVSMDLYALWDFPTSITGEVYFVTGSKTNTGTVIPGNANSIANLDLEFEPGYIFNLIMGKGLNLGVNMSLSNNRPTELSLYTPVTVNANLNINAGTINFNQGYGLTVNSSGTLNVGVPNSSTSISSEYPPVLNFGNSTATQMGQTPSGSLTINSNGSLNIGATANVNMYADSTLTNNGTINVAPGE